MAYLTSLLLYQDFNQFWKTFNFSFVWQAFGLNLQHFNVEHETSLGLIISLMLLEKSPVCDGDKPMTKISVWHTLSLSPISTPEAKNEGEKTQKQSDIGYLYHYVPTQALCYTCYCGQKYLTLRLSQYKTQNVLHLGIRTLN